MATGFGKQKSKPQLSEGAKQRAGAAKKYEQMKSEGTPDYEAYIRIRGKKQWYPVGVIAVKRSGQIDRAIFDSQDALLQGAFRLYPVLKKNQNQLEYGYRLKEFKDDPIQLAVPPMDKGPSVLGKMQERVAGLFKR